jgi:hypothetical protein
VLEMVNKLLAIAANEAIDQNYIPDYFMNIKDKLKRIIDSIELL